MTAAAKPSRGITRRTPDKTAFDGYRIHKTVNRHGFVRYVACRAYGGSAGDTLLAAENLLRQLILLLEGPRAWKCGRLTAAAERRIRKLGFAVRRPEP